LATRADTIGFLRGINGMKENDDGSFIYEVQLKDNRTQLVFMVVLDEVLLMTSPFATKDDITAAKALDLAVIFGVSEVGNFYALRHLLFLEDLDVSEIVNGTTFLAIRADTLEQQVGGDRM